MLAFSNDYYGMIFRATQSVELFCAYEEIDRKFRGGGGIITLYTYATFENTTSDAGTTKVDNKRRI